MLRWKDCILSFKRRRLRTEQFGNNNCMIYGEYQVVLWLVDKINQKYYRDWFICQYSFSFYLLQAIGEDKMNAVEILLKNGEDAMFKSPTTWPKAKIMVHDNEGGRLIISESYKITILFQCHPLYWISLCNIFSCRDVGKWD